MRVWRIATDTPDFVADDLTGAGARLTGGRWNRPGQPVLYCAVSSALACLETLVHLGTGSLPMNRYLVAIDIPDAVWAARAVETPASLPVGSLPSAIVPEDEIILINPQHPDAVALTATKLRKWLYDPRLF